MKFLVFLSFFLVYATSSSLYNSVSCSPDVVQVCCYSTSPADYTPNCYSCPSNVYTSSLLACVNATEMPRNITFKQANCMEKNCQINYPSSPPNNGLEGLRYQELATILSQLFSLPSRASRSVDNGDAPALGGASPRKKRGASGNIIKTVNTLVTGLGDMEFGEMEYV